MELQTDSLNRRLRFRRQPTGKKVFLTERDLEILRLLNRYRYLRSTTLLTFFGGNPKRFAERLGRLFHEGIFINRPARQWEIMNANYLPVVYELADAGKRALTERGIEVLTHRGEAREFHHELMSCDIVSSIELACGASRHLRFVPWHEISEYEGFPPETRSAENPLALPSSYSHRFAATTHHGEKPIIPDAVFGIEYRCREWKFFALEADRHSEPVYRSNLNQTSYLRKFLQYQSVMREHAYRKRWGVPKLLVLNVTIHEEHRRNIERQLLDLQPKGAPYHLFKVLPPIGSFERGPGPSTDILMRPWRRVGHPDLDITTCD